MANANDFWHRLPRQIRALMEYLPEPGSVWPSEERAAWFLLLTRALNTAYPVRERVPEPVKVYLPGAVVPEYWEEVAFQLEGLTPA